MQWWRKRWWWGLGVVVGLMVLSAWVLPALLRWQLEQQASVYLGRTVRVESLQWQPWRLAITVEGVHIGAAGGEGPPLLSVQRVALNASLQSLLRRAPVLESVEVLGPSLSVQHLGQGRYDVDDLLHKWMQPEPQDAPPPRFAIADLRLTGGEIAFTDHSAPGAPRYTVHDISLSLPFASSLPAQAEQEVTPQLSFRVDKSRFDSAAQATPFAAHPQGALQLRWKALDLGAYRQYWPAVLPLRLHSAVLDAELAARFVKEPQGLAVSGALTLRDVVLRDADQHDVLAWQRLQVQIQEFDPLGKRLVVQRVEWDAPRLRLWRDAAGRLQPWQAALQNATNNVATKPYGTSGNGQKDEKKVVASQPWMLELAQLAVRDGAVQWHDAYQGLSAALDLGQLAVEGGRLRWPAATAAEADGSALSLRGTVSSAGAKAAARWELQASGGMASGQARWQVHDGALALVRPYLAQWLIPTVDATVQAQGSLQWKDGALHSATVEQLRLAELGVRDGTDTLAQWREAQWRDVRVDLRERRVQVAAMVLRQPQLRLERLADGSWQAQQWLRQGNTPTLASASAPTLATATATAPTSASVPLSAPVPTPPPIAAAPSEPPWDVQLQDLRVEGGSLAWRDATTPTPVVLNVSAVALQLQSLRLGGAPMPVQLDARVGTGQVEPGRLRFKGQLGWSPMLQAQGQLLLQDAPAHALAPYVADRLAVEVLRAEANFDGDLRYEQSAAGPVLELRGDAALEDFRANTVRADGARDELLSWKALTLPGLRLSLAPQQALRLGLRELTLNDFYARLIVTAQGRLNLQDLLKLPEPALPAMSAEGAQRVVAGGAVPPATALAPDIDIGALSLVQGRVLFSDRFIQPNYTAELTELQGRVGRIRSRSDGGTPQWTPLEVRGRAEGTATLWVGGKFKPGAQPLALDIQGKVRDLELSPLSPYAVKYAGHGIERGKLNVDVGYLLGEDGQLQAQNKIVLKQLQFGDQVEGATASLPVKLAVALLADSQGVIDIDLPISGSLNDPQFELGAVLWKVFTNLVAKAITAPFKLLAGVFSGGQSEAQTSAVAFESGQAELGASARSSLDALAQALLQRPGVRLTVVGAANAATEHPAMQRQRLREMLLAEKRRRVAAEGGDAANVKAVEEGEYSRLLAQVYRRADIQKPRHWVGWTKDLSDAEMEDVILASITLGDEAVRELALRRAVAVKDYLATAQVPLERMFVGPVKTSGFDETWSPRVELGLGM